MRSLRWLLVAAGVITWGGTGHAAPEEWKFVFVMASSDWDVRTGIATIERSGASMKSRFVDVRGIDYEFSATIKGNNVVGRVLIIPSDSSGFAMKWTYTRRTYPELSPCVWYSIQLLDGYNFFALLRTEDKCKR
jgi:hypothetical protein